MGAKAATEPPFTLETVGTYSCHGVEPGQRQGETNAKINQDRGSTTYPLGKDGDYCIWCVFDGHGAPARPPSPPPLLEGTRLLPTASI